MTETMNEKLAPEPSSLDQPKEKGSAEEPDIQASYDHSVLRDGVKLHPQPTADPLDPLNWSSFKKHTILGIVMFK